MVQFNKQRQRMLQLSLYQLKKDLGVGPLDIYKHGGTDTDLCTGERELNRTRARIKLAIPLSKKSSRRVIQTISKIGAAKDFVYGGYYDRDTKVFIVAKEDLPFELNQDDWFIFDDKKFQIKEFWEADTGMIYVIVGQRLKGDTFSQEYEQKARDVIFLGESVNAS